MTRPAQASSAVTGTTSTNTDNYDWRHQGECAQIDHLPSGHRMHRHDPDTWYPDGTSGRYAAKIAEAKAICDRCPVLETCRTDALESGEAHGIWGGLTEDERRAIKRRAAKGRGKPRAATKNTDPAPPKPPRPTGCGTMPGYRRHTDAHEPACDPCKAAKRAASARDRRRQRGHTEQAA